MRPRDAAKLTLLGSVVVAKTISELYELKAEIKWPNDILISQRKLCGILTEGEIREEKLRFAVLGFGLNANFSLEALPKHLRELATTLNEQLGRKISREILLFSLLQNADKYYEMLSDGKFETILNDWRRLSGFLGSYVEIASCREKIEGWAVDLDNDGALIVRLKDQTTQRVISGEVARIVRVKRPTP
jgi:BirA family biotin operon repressor/biotin-[acetyl-CoA-carboxylase] ligase